MLLSILPISQYISWVTDRHAIFQVVEYLHVYTGLPFSAPRNSSSSDIKSSSTCSSSSVGTAEPTSDGRVHELTEIDELLTEAIELHATTAHRTIGETDTASESGVLLSEESCVAAYMRVLEAAADFGRYVPVAFDSYHLHAFYPNNKAIYAVRK